jgi:tetratricopeptide (TPR) repeat protein
VSQVHTSFSLPPATAGSIARINLKSACERAWQRFREAPLRPGIAEGLVELEQLTMEFLGDVQTLDRLQEVVGELKRHDGDSSQSALISAQVAAMAHRFTDAREDLARAEALGASVVSCQRLALSVDQACGTNLEGVLRQRRKLAETSGRLEDLVSLGAVLTDLRYFREAEATYRRAIQGYQDVSPFALAWACFRLGVLWGEHSTPRSVELAAWWYRRALDYLPHYTKARVHLAELLTAEGNPEAAMQELSCVTDSSDPEVYWRLSEAETLLGAHLASAEHLHAAHALFEEILQRHLLAFADHGAEFFSSAGGNVRRALELACVNVANRPTLRAYEQAHSLALSLCAPETAAHLLREARRRWAQTHGFGLSSLSSLGVEVQDGAEA